jgi:hypothetical protein
MPSSDAEITSLLLGKLVTLQPLAIEEAPDREHTFSHSAILAHALNTRYHGLIDLQEACRIRQKR